MCVSSECLFLDVWLNQQRDWMRSMKLSIRPSSIPSPHCGQPLTLHYGIINLPLQRAGAPTGKTRWRAKGSFGGFSQNAGKHRNDICSWILKSRAECLNSLICIIASNAADQHACVPLKKLGWKYGKAKEEESCCTCKYKDQQAKAHWCFQSFS